MDSTRCFAHQSGHTIKDTGTISRAGCHQQSNYLTSREHGHHTFEATSYLQRVAASRKL